MLQLDRREGKAGGKGRILEARKAVARTLRAALGAGRTEDFPARHRPLENACRLLGHFNLTALPFTRAVSDAALLRHRTFTEALARLSLALSTRIPAVLTDDPGLGKSTLLGTLADSLDKAKTHLVYTGLCSCGPFGLVGQLAVRYGVRPKRSAAQTAQPILDELARSERAEILILDDASTLEAHAVTEEVERRLVEAFGPCLATIHVASDETY